MEKKDKIEIALTVLLLLLSASGMLLVRQEGFHFVFPLLLLSVWTITLLWTSWKHISGKYPPKLNNKEEETEDADEVVFSMANSQKEYLHNTLFHLSGTRLKTWSYFFVTVFLTYFAINGIETHFMLGMLVAQTVIFALSVVRSYRYFSKKFRDYKKANFLIIFNKNGMLGAVPRLSTVKGKNMVYIYTAFTDWNDIHEIVFYKTHIEVSYAWGLKEFLMADNEKQLAQFKKLLNANYRTQHSKKTVLNLQNYPHILGNISKTAISISTEEGNSFQLGESYIAPIPSVPKNFKWPHNHQLPLAFLAQINCKDLAPHDTENLLPKEGILYFFYEMKEMLLNEKGNQGCARVVYSNVPNNQLYFHKDSTRFINGAHLLRQRKLKFHSKNSMPNFEEACRMDPSIALSNSETYNYTCWNYKRNLKKKEENYDEMVQFFGNPLYHTRQELDMEQTEDMLLLMQITLTKEDFYAYYQSMSDYSTKGINYRKFFDRWDELPCQLYYFIPKNDLKRLDFSNIYFARRGKNLDNLVLPDDISGMTAN